MRKKILVLGGGIIGLSIAYKLLTKYKNIEVCLLEKEDSIGKHQSGNNSGVLHCGLYYKTNSLKAKLAVGGIKEMTLFCEKNNIPHEICGKTVIATNDSECKTLEKLAKQGHDNGLQGLKFLTTNELSKREPNVKAQKALLVPQEGIVDYKMVMHKLVELIINQGGKFIFNFKNEELCILNNNITLKNSSMEEKFDYLINTTGLYSDLVYSKITQEKRPFRIVPFRGEYMFLKENAKDIFNHLVYPVPDIKYPFLGVHFTRMIGGNKEVGPNAVLAFKREGYNTYDFSLKETLDYLTYLGFSKFILNNFKFCLGEFYSSVSAESFISKAKKLIPEIKLEHLQKGNAGVRAQALLKSGDLLMDFNIIRKGNQLHLLNAPSPGATSALSIADYLIENHLFN